MSFDNGIENSNAPLRSDADHAECGSAAATQSGTKGETAACIVYPVCDGKKVRQYFTFNCYNSFKNNDD